MAPASLQPDELQALRIAALDAGLPAPAGDVSDEHLFLLATGRLEQVPAPRRAALLDQVGRDPALARTVIRLQEMYADESAAATDEGPGAGTAAGEAEPRLRLATGEGDEAARRGDAGAGDARRLRFQKMARFAWAALVALAAGLWGLRLADPPVAALTPSGEIQVLDADRGARFAAKAADGSALRARAAYERDRQYWVTAATCAAGVVGVVVAVGWAKGLRTAKR